LVRIGTTVPARIWSGPAPLSIPGDYVETEDDATYLGGGTLLSDFSDIEQLINGTADRLDLSVSGVSRRTISLALQEAGDVKGADVDIGVVWFDDDWQITRVRWEARYRADKLSVNRTGGERTITLSMGSDDTGRSRSNNAYWTPADQRRRSPDDAICDHVPGINAGTARIFAPK
jgi:hypothetical protein